MWEWLAAPGLPAPDREPRDIAWFAPPQQHDAKKGGSRTAIRRLSQRGLERVKQRSDRGFGRYRHRCIAFRVHHAVVDAGVAEVDFKIRRAWQGALDERLAERVFDV